MQGGMGFIQTKDMPAKGLNEKVERTAVEAARRKFSPEFMNRLDKVVVFHPLKRNELDEVPDIELRQVQKRVSDCATSPFQFRITNEARLFLLQEGTDQRYGARHLKRAIQRYVVCPIARLLATAQVRPGDLLLMSGETGTGKEVIARAIHDLNPRRSRWRAAASRCLLACAPAVRCCPHTGSAVGPRPVLSM